MENIKHENIRITASEMGALWNTYMIESLVHHVFSYYLNHVEDQDIKNMLVILVNETRDSVKLLESVFKQEKLPVPRGITSEDIVPDAPRLFSDKYYLIYTKSMARFAATMFSLAYTQSTRSDLRQFFRHYVNRITIVDQQLTELLLSKGIYTRPPAIPIPNKVDFVKDRSFFSSFIGRKRPLTALEITHLFFGAQSNAIGKALMIGFSQVAQAKELKQYFTRGKEIANKFMELFNKILVTEEISISPSFDSEVMASTQSPFSDRLMLFHTNLLNSGGFGTYGMAFSASPRLDLALLYVRVMFQVGLYSKAGANLLIKNGWMEQPPSAPEHNALSMYHKEKSLIPQPAKKPIDEKHDDNSNE